MLPRLSWLTLAFISLCISEGLSQDDNSSAALSVLPNCAANCLIEAYGTGICEPGDLGCSCTNEQYLNTVTLCVGANCTVTEALFTKNATSTLCGAPIRNRAPEHTAVVGTLVAISAIAVIVRFSYRLFVAKVEFGLDDWFILATLACVASSETVTEAGTIPNGLGRDLYTLSPKEITGFFYFFYHMAWLYFLEMPLMKLSMLFFFLRIFPHVEAKRVIYGTIGFTVVWGAAYVLASIFQCTPVNYYWLRWDGLHEGNCFDNNPFTWSQAAINILLDFWMLAIPLWQIRNLQMSRKKKIGVASMFAVGTFVTVISMVRLHSLVRLSSRDNITYEFWDVSIWSSIEVCVGIICACMPTIRLALAKFFPSIMGGSSVETGGYYGSRSRDRSKSAPRRSRLSGNPLGQGLAGPDNGAVRVTVEGGYGAKGHHSMSGYKGHTGMGGIVVSQQRSVHNITDVDIDEYVAGDGESSNSDEATLVKMKDLTPMSPRFPN